jgi:hypothetical protein
VAVNIMDKLAVRCFSCTNPSSVGNKRDAEGGEAGDDCCPWTGTLETMHAHNSQCGRVLVQCQWPSCDQQSERRRIQQHEASCALRREKCPWCSLWYPFESAFSHRLACGCRPSFHCTNVAACDAAFHMRKDREYHERICIHRIVLCPYKQSLGCSYSCVHQHMAAHSADAALHLTLALDNQKRESSLIIAALASGNFRDVEQGCLFRLTGGSQHFADFFKNHIVVECAGIISASLDNEEKLVSDLIEAHDRYVDIVSRTFAGDACFSQALTDAFVELVNRECLGWSGMHYLISAYCDRFLKTGYG